MDRFEKFLRKIDAALTARVRSALGAIAADRLERLDIKPMQGHKATFRCRVGNVRIVFQRIMPGVNEFADIGFRRDIYKRWK